MVHCLLKSGVVHAASLTLMQVKQIIIVTMMLVAMTGDAASVTRASPITSDGSRLTIGPHGGQIVRDKFHVFEVRLDRGANKIDVYALQLRSEPPQNMTVRLYFDPVTSQDIELTAINYDDPIPHYQGDVTAANDKYVAVGITFRINLVG